MTAVGGVPGGMAERSVYDRYDPLEEMVGPEQGESLDAATASIEAEIAKEAAAKRRYDRYELVDVASRGAAAPPAAPAPQLAAAPAAQDAFKPMHLVVTTAGLVPVRPMQHEKDRGENKKGDVKYAGEAERREKYGVTMGATLTRRGRVFDTAEIKKHFSDKRKMDFREPRAGLGGQVLEGAGDLSQYWGENSLIWVCAVDSESRKPSFYSHVGKIGRFHHSSLVAGEDVVGAGEWIVVNGKLTKISANSGHYQPTLTFLQQSIGYMTEALHQDTQVLLYNTASGWGYVNAKDINRLDQLGGAGEWKAHSAANAG
jgi:hypothetical protein